MEPTFEYKSTIRATIFIAIFGLPIALPGYPQSDPRTENCWSAKPPDFPAGTQESVLRQSFDFLVIAEGVPVHPYWPKGRSGITIGVGRDLGQHSEKELKADWSRLGPDTLKTLRSAVHKSGADAQLLLPELKSIDIPKDVSLSVFRDSLGDTYYPNTVQLFPGLLRLPTEAQVALVSVVFNRGKALGRDPDWKTAKELDQRWEMRRLQDDVRRGDLFAIYIRLGTMKRLWDNPEGRGLRYRRRDEQHLIRPYVDKELKWEEHRDKLKEAGLPPCPK